MVIRRVVRPARRCMMYVFAPPGDTRSPKPRNLASQ